MPGHGTTWHEPAWHYSELFLVVDTEVAESNDGLNDAVESRMPRDEE